MMATDALHPVLRVSEVVEVLDKSRHGAPPHVVNAADLKSLLGEDHPSGNVAAPRLPSTCAGMAQTVLIAHLNLLWTFETTEKILILSFMTMPCPTMGLRGWRMFERVATVGILSAPRVHLTSTTTTTIILLTTVTMVIIIT